MADLYERASTELSAIVPEVWSKNYYDVLLDELPFRSIISDDYQGEIQQLGDTVKISSFPEFSDAIDLVGEEDKNDADSITVTQQSLLINKQVVKDFIVTDRAMLQSLPSMDKLKELAGYSIQKKVEKDLIALVAPVLANQLAYTVGTTLDLVDILNAKEALDSANVPMSDRNMVVGSEQLNDIFNIVGFTSSDFVTSGTPLQSGQLPSALLGFSPQFTNLVGSTAHFFHRSFMTIAAQKGLTIKEYDLGVNGIRATRVNLDTLLGIKQLDADRVVTIG